LQVFETAGGPVDVADCDPRQRLDRRRAGDGIRRDIVEDEPGGVGIGEAIVQLLGLDTPVLSGLTTMPANWHAQCRLAIFEPVLQDDSQRSPCRRPSAVNPPATRAISSYQNA
jgi:hypothetical protein